MSDSSSHRQVIAIAGAGDLGRYICEELLASPDYSVVILTRSTANKWFTTSPPTPTSTPIPTHQTDYTVPSLLPILNATRATTFISLLSIPTPAYIPLHTSLLTACSLSLTCKRLIPSEWAGDSERHPTKPAYYATSRLPFREILARQDEVEWTLLNCGWLMDYFLPEGKSYMAPITGKFPVDAGAWRACLRGSGAEVQSWTRARDVGRAVVALCRASRGQWEMWTFVAGEWGSFEDAVKMMEEFYERPMPRTYKSREQIQSALAAHAADDPISEELETAQVEEMMVEGCMACPREKTLRQRERYFGDIHFMGLKELLRYAEARERV